MEEESEHVLEPLRNGADFTLYRGRKRGQDMPILAVAVASEDPSPQSIGRLEHEYALAGELDAAWAARPLALGRHQGRAMLILEDPGGEPLDRIIAQHQGRPRDLTRVLRIAIGLAATLGQVHRRGMVHKDVKPANAFVDAADRVWLTGFGIASRLPRERLTPAPPEIIAGTLAYMSPEQTGRMNRSVDARSDLYSLGVTLYEMLTDSLPFAATDPLEWVHCHIARQPVAPVDRGEVPAQLSTIVMRLLAKNAEERYQTAAGVETDLRHCLAEWQTRGRIDPFRLGAGDAPDRLMIPEKLYGREREVETLLAAFNRVVAQGAAELVLVSGYSGVGKSSVVNELYKVLVPPNGLFAAGKFDQFKRDVPYATLAQAFQMAVRQILVKSETEVGHWRHAFQEAFGANGQLMVSLIPELEFIVGKQPPVAELPPQEARRRFRVVFERFVAAFARPEHPLALFLDDLQWLDTATLELLEHLATDPDVRNLLLIGAYRDNEVGPSHPLMRTLAAIRGAGAKTREIVLAPLALGDVGRLVAEALRSEREAADHLARLIQVKTGGNPFFTIQFITELEQDGLLRFEPRAAAWQWDVGRIRAKGYTANVVELMVARLSRLPEATQDALKQLACLGSSAEFDRLRAVYGDSSEEMHEQLWNAVRTGLILRTETSYRFLHDRVQEAAYSLIPEPQRARAHLRIGRLFKRNTPPERRDEAIFDIVNQLNLGAGLMTDATEREEAAALNLIAARRAKASAAHASALRYLHAGRALLEEEHWDRAYDLIFSIEYLMAECELHAADMAAAEMRLRMLAGRAATRHDFALVTRLQITLYTTLDRSESAIDVFLDYLGRNGTEWSRHPARDAVIAEYNRIWALIGSRQIEDLIDLPPMEDADVLDMLDVFTEVVHPAMFFDENLSTLVVCRMVALCLEHGTCDASCFGYVWFGMFAGPRFANYRDGFRFGQLGYDLVKKRDLTRYEARTYISFATLMPWGKPALMARDLVRRAFDVAYRTGDLTFSAYAWHVLITNYLAVGDPLSKVQAEAETGLGFVRKAGFGLVVENCAAQLGLIRTLRGLTPTFGCFDHDDYSESDTEQRLSRNPALALAEFFYWTRKLQARFFAGDPVAAVAAARKAQPLLWPAASQVETGDFRFYAALAHAAALNSASGDARQEHLAALAEHHHQLETWALHCPANFETRSALVGAEIARLEGRDLDAQRLYQRAMDAARDSGFLHNEALACETAAGFYGARGFVDIAEMYLARARDGYRRWGADGKVRQLEARHPRLVRAEARAAGEAAPSPGQQLDVAAVTKASQALSSEIELPKLIERLMTIAMQSAGADRGLLILPERKDYRIEVEAGMEGEQVVLQYGAASGHAVPDSIIRYVMRTQESVILADAARQNLFSGDPYLGLRQPHSVLCLPLVRQGVLSGLLYLENTLASHVFTPDRARLLELLASQAAISLENAHLYADLQLQAELLQRLPVSAWTLKPDGTPDFVNDVWLEFSGQSPDFTRSHPEAWMEVIHPEDREMALGIFRDAVRSGQAFAFETRSRRARDGEYRWHLQRAEVLRDAEGRVLKFVGTTTDIDALKRAEEELRASETSLRQITETIPEMLWSASPDGTVDYCNGRFLEYTGLGLEQAMSNGWMDVLHPDDLEPTLESWMSCVKSGAPYRVEVRTFHAADQSYRWCVTSALPLLDADGRIVKWHGTVVDMQDWKQGQEDLRQTQADLAHVERVATLNAMTASIAHEVSQPLAGILTNAETGARMLAADPPDPAGAARAFQRTIRDTNRATELLQRLRAMFSKKASVLEMVDLNDAVREVIALSAGELQRRRALLQTDFAEDLAFVQADRVQLQQVILNLLLNGADAMEGIEDRPRTLLVRTGPQDDGGVGLEVRDAGVGVNPATVEKLFDAFYTTKAHGMGVGLAICRSIIENHGGHLWGQANDGPGATFSFSIRAAAKGRDSLE